MLDTDERCAKFSMMKSGCQSDMTFERRWHYCDEGRTLDGWWMVGSGEMWEEELL
jgi:hypothetical protein